MNETNRPVDEETETDAILAALDGAGFRYPRSAIERAVVAREAITPRLLARLEDTLADPEAALARPSRTGVPYAALLLAWFREPRAHRLFVGLFRLPGAQVDALFGQVTSSYVGGMLYATCAGDLTAIRAMVTDPGVFLWCRTQAARALTLAVADGTADRREVLVFLRDRVLAAAAPPAAAERSDAAAGRSDAAGAPGGGLATDPELLDVVGQLMLDLWPDVAADELRAARNDGRLPEWVVDEGELEEILAEGEAAALERLRAELARQLPGDVHAYMERWAVDRTHAAAWPAPRPGPSTTRGRDERNQRRKTAKQSRAKNRAKKRRK